MIIDNLGVAVADGVSVLHAVGEGDRETVSVVEDIGILHVGRIKSDLDPLSGKLSRNIVLIIVDPDDGILADFPLITVIESFFQPFTGFRNADVAFGGKVTVDRTLVDPCMEGLVVSLDIVPEQVIELFQRMNL